jgi:hypothetical protein
VSASNPSIQEAEAEGSRVRGQFGPPNEILSLPKGGSFMCVLVMGGDLGIEVSPLFNCFAVLGFELWACAC